MVVRWENLLARSNPKAFTIACHEFSDIPQYLPTLNTKIASIVILSYR
jgi:hypothetical protein